MTLPALQRIKEIEERFRRCGDDCLLSGETELLLSAFNVMKQLCEEANNLGFVDLEQEFEERMSKVPRE